MRCEGTMGAMNKTVVERDEVRIGANLVQFRSYPDIGESLWDWYGVGYFGAETSQTGSAFDPSEIVA